MADPTVFGYRWTRGEKLKIHFPEVNLPQELKALPPRPTLPSRLEALPVEIAHRVCEELTPVDLTSLYATSSTCHYFVRTLRAYAELYKYAQQALLALTPAHVHREYSARQLHELLRSQNCGLCGDYGPYLYLLQGIRACSLCLENEKRAISVPSDKACASLKKAEWKPSSPANPEPWLELYNPSEGVTLVSWATILDLTHNSPKITNPNFRPAHRFDDSGFTKEEYTFAREFHHRASVAFPSLSRKGTEVLVQHGLWCRGCEDTWNLKFMDFFNDDTLKAECYTLRDTAYSVDNFREHCSVCPGVERLKTQGWPDQYKPPQYRSAFEDAFRD